MVESLDRGWFTLADATVVPADVLKDNGDGTIQIKLLDRSGTVIDRVDYSNASVWNGKTIAASPAIAHSVDVVVDFGATPSFHATVVVTGQTWMTLTTLVIPILKPAAGTGDEAAVLEFSTAIADRVNAVGFTLTVYAPNGARGTYTFTCKEVL